MSFSKTRALLDQLLGIEISCGAIATIRQRLSAVLEQPLQEALDCARQQPLACVDETGALGAISACEQVHYSNKWLSAVGQKSVIRITACILDSWDIFAAESNSILCINIAI